MIQRAVSFPDPKHFVPLAPPSPRPSSHCKIAPATAPPVAPEPGQSHGFVLPDPVAAVHFQPRVRDVLLFPRAPALVTVPGGFHDFLDPVSTVWCRPGYSLQLSSFGRSRVRVDWATTAHVESALAGAWLEPPHVERDRPLGIYFASPKLFLAQRLLALGRPVPRWVRAEPTALALRAMALGSWHDSRSRRSGSDAPALVRAARRHLALSYDQPVPLPAIAEELGASSAHLSRAFKRCTGLSPMAYRHELRMRAALELLERRDADLCETGFALGYSSHSHFTERFRRTFGVTPSAYRSLASGAGN